MVALRKKKGTKPRVKTKAKTITPAATPSKYQVQYGGINKLTRTCSIIKRPPTGAQPAEEDRPTLVFCNDAWMQMRYIVDETPTELGWFFFVDAQKDNVYRLHTCVVPPQTVSAAYVEIDSEALVDTSLKLHQEGHDLSTMYAWFHSHVNMPVNPSLTDEEEVEEHLDTCPIFIRGITNKKGDIEVNVYLRDKGIAYMDVDFHVEGRVLDEKTEQEMTDILADNLTPERIAPLKPGAGAQTFYGADPWAGHDLFDPDALTKVELRAYDPNDFLMDFGMCKEEMFKEFQLRRMAPAEFKNCFGYDKPAPGQPFPGVPKLAQH